MVTTIPWNASMAPGVTCWVQAGRAALAKADVQRAPWSSPPRAKRRNAGAMTTAVTLLIGVTQSTEGFGVNCNVRVIICRTGTQNLSCCDKMYTFFSIRVNFRQLKLIRCLVKLYQHPAVLALSFFFKHEKQIKNTFSEMNTTNSANNKLVCVCAHVCACVCVGGGLSCWVCSPVSRSGIHTSDVWRSTDNSSTGLPSNRNVGSPIDMPEARPGVPAPAADVPTLTAVGAPVVCVCRGIVVVAKLKSGLLRLTDFARSPVPSRDRRSSWRTVKVSLSSATTAPARRLCAVQRLSWDDVDAVHPLAVHVWFAQ